MSRPKLALLSSVVPVLILSTACDQGDTDPPGTEVAQVTLALTAAPPDAGCLQLVVAGSRTATFRFDLRSGQAAAAFPLTSLPTGQSVLTADAFAAPCALAAPDTAATWVSEAMLLALVPGPNPPIDLVLRPNATSSVRVSFLAPARQCSVTLAACVSDGQCCSRKCRRPVGSPDGRAVGVCVPGQPVERERPIVARPEALPASAGLLPPESEGDTFFVSFKTRPQPAPGGRRAVMSEFAAPALRAAGFTRGLDELWDRDGGPETLPGGSLPRLAAAVCAPYLPAPQRPAPPAPLLRISPGSSSFGSVAVGTQSPPTLLSVTNGGTGATGSLAVALAGPGQDSFTIAAHTCASLAPGATCTVDVRFAPRVAGPLEAALTVASAGVAASAALAGSGVAVGGAPLVVSPASAQVLAGGSVTFTVVNMTGAPTTPAVTLTGSATFSLTANGCAGTVASGGSCTVVVGYRPIAAVGGSHGATLLVAAGNFTTTAQLTGTSLQVDPGPCTDPLGCPGGVLAPLILPGDLSAASDPQLAHLRSLCAAMMNRRAASADTDRYFKTALGMSFAQFRAEVERSTQYYVFQQRVGAVPIEHVAVIALARPGESVHTMHGTFLNRYRLGNRVGLTVVQAIARGEAQLLALEALERAPARQFPTQLVLLPHGSAEAAGGPVTELRYAYRTLLGGSPRQQGPRGARTWLAWIDAQTGELLDLAPQFHDASARGDAWERAPGGNLYSADFTIDGLPKPELHALTRDQVFLGVGSAARGAGPLGLSGTGASDDPVLFWPPSDPVPPGPDDFGTCALPNPPSPPPTGDNGDRFRMTNAFAHLSRFHDAIYGAGTITPLPQVPILVGVDDPGPTEAVYDAPLGVASLLRFEAGGSFAAPMCEAAPATRLNAALDATILYHEFAHLAVHRLQDRRDPHWCGPGLCSIPQPYVSKLLHHFADGYAATLAGTPCVGGWFAQNPASGAAGSALDCAGNTSEAGGLPRLGLVDLQQASALGMSLALPDGFPPHRTFTDEYADGQIALGALWLARSAMWSKASAAGVVLLLARLNQTIWNFGFRTPLCADENGFSVVQCDKGFYRLTHWLLLHLANTWLIGDGAVDPHNGAQAVNGVLGAFARAGVFLIPRSCVDGAAGTTMTGYCPTPGGENGGTAIIDVDESGAGVSSEVIIGVNHPLRDYYAHPSAGGAPPRFRVWTGPPFRFSGNHDAPLSLPPSPTACNDEYQVELWTGGGIPFISPWLPAVNCHATFEPTPDQWSALLPPADAVGETSVYYKVTTRRLGGTNPKVSTNVEIGEPRVIRAVPAPYVIVNASGVAPYPSATP